MNIWKGNFPQKRIFGLFSKFYTKLAITQPKYFFFEKLKKCFLDRCMRNVIYQFQSSNGQDKPVRQYGRQTGITKNLANFWQKNCCEFFSFTCYYICKKNYGYISSGFPTVTLQSYKEILKKNRKRAITPDIFFQKFEKTVFRRSHEESYPKISKL